MFRIINGILIKCNSTDKEIVLPNDVTGILSDAFLPVVESIIGYNVINIYGKLNGKNIKVLKFPKLNKVDDINCPNLLELEVSENFSSSSSNLTPCKVVVCENEYFYSFEARETFKLIDSMYNLNVYRKDSNVIYIYNGEFKYSFGDSPSIITAIVNLNRLLSMIPDEIRNEILYSEYKIFITNTNMYADDSFIAGIVYERLKLCVVSESFMVELLHEFGHIYDNLHNISNSEDFANIYKEEKLSIYSNIKKPLIMVDHIRSSSREYFAESFKKYILNKDEFFKECPMTKLYIDNVVNEVKMNKKDSNVKCKCKH